MKKLLLLLASGSIALSGFAQQRSVFDAPSTPQDQRVISTKGFTGPKSTGSSYAAKTTASSRWYSYFSYQDTALSFYGQVAGGSLPYLWNDTMSFNAYSGGVWGYNTMVSYGSILSPFFTRPSLGSVGGPVNGFNDYSLYPGEQKITSTDGYSVDSLIVYGVYEMNPAKYAMGIVDTIKIRLVSGDGGSTDDIFGDGYTTGNTSRYGVDTVRFMSMLYDSVRNITGGTTASATQIYLIDTSMWGDTLSNGVMPIVIGVKNASGAATPFTVPAGNLVGASISFKSGDPTFPITGDTVNYGNGNWKYNMFRAWVWATSTVSGSTVTTNYAKYDPVDPNEGVFKSLPNYTNGWGNQYVPMWAWGVTGPSGLQYPVMSYKLSCAACGVVEPTGAVSDVKNINTAYAYPNPAEDVVNVPFTLNSASNVTVTLVNMVGQTVATKSLTNVNAGTVTFSTATLPSGLYTFSVNANGQRSTGRVVVAH